MLLLGGFAKFRTSVTARFSANMWLFRCYAYVKVFTVTQK